MKLVCACPRHFFLPKLFSQSKSRTPLRPVEHSVAKHKYSFVRAILGRCATGPGGPQAERWAGREAEHDRRQVRRRRMTERIDCNAEQPGSGAAVRGATYAKPTEAWRSHAARHAARCVVCSTLKRAIVMARCLSACERGCGYGCVWSRKLWGGICGATSVSFVSRLRERLFCCGCTLRLSRNLVDINWIDSAWLGGGEAGAAGRPGLEELFLAVD